MARHIQIKTLTETDVHLDAVYGADYTLCGLESGGDRGLSIEEGIVVKKKVTCEMCIGIVKFCKTIKATELKSQ